MTDEQDYILPHEEPTEQRPPADPKTLDYLDALGWRPFTEEW